MNLKSVKLTYLACYKLKYMSFNEYSVVTTENKCHEYIIKHNVLGYKIYFMHILL